MKKNVTILLIASTVSIVLSLSCIAESPFTKTKAYENNFSDIPETEWFTSGVKTVYEYGLMDGVKTDKFDADGSVTIAQGITIAARLHSTYYRKDIPDSTLENPKWYDKYVLYATDNKLISEDQFSNYERAIESYEIVQMFGKALPEEFLPAINNVSNLPDVSENNSYYASTIRFYNAGILNGNDEHGSFYPTSTLTRKRMAVILSRIADESQRLKYTLSTEKPPYTVSEVFDIINKITTPEALDELSIMKVGNSSIPVSNYRRYYMYFASAYSGNELKEIVLDNIRFYEAVKQICIDKNIMFPYEYMRDFLCKYYEYKISYGENFELYLSLMNATERALCEQEMIYTLYSYMLNQLFGYGAEMAATDDEVLKYALINDYIHAKHILILEDTENASQLINEIYVKAAQGEDFDELISKYGQDPGMKARPEGYFFTKGEMVEEFEKAAYSLENGQISGIVKTEYGYHIIKREAFDVETFKNSSTFLEIFGICSGQKGKEYIEEKAKMLVVEYVDSFDKIISLFE